MPKSIDQSPEKNKISRRGLFMGTAVVLGAEAFSACGDKTTAGDSTGAIHGENIDPTPSGTPDGSSSIETSPASSTPDGGKDTESKAEKLPKDTITKMFLEPLDTFRNRNPLDQIRYLVAYQQYREWFDTNPPDRLSSIAQQIFLDDQHGNHDMRDDAFNSASEGDSDDTFLYRIYNSYLWATTSSCTKMDMLDPDKGDPTIVAYYSEHPTSSLDPTLSVIAGLNDKWGTAITSRSQNDEWSQKLNALCLTEVNEHWSNNGSEYSISLPDSSKTIQEASTNPITNDPTVKRTVTLENGATISAFLHKDAFALNIDGSANYTDIPISMWVVLERIEAK